MHVTYMYRRWSADMNKQLLDSNFLAVKLSCTRNNGVAHGTISKALRTASRRPAARQAFERLAAAVIEDRRRRPQTSPLNVSAAQSPGAARPRPAPPSVESLVGSPE